ncbi:serine/threonine protein kinase [Allocatelliglobosispora scoriae]|uniref:Serine/threonine protein kinase n=1 Tax=Allocatelliglobosispora scoriae TaxID=643052 RepID=A0A841C185_9ACTN|nr:hypothetical protein [Allocatelliglobosispora scoriae]MBB5873099.1 serine/threonine protein kinase [Allocatelliglobosispora scoriae]
MYNPMDDSSVLFTTVDGDEVEWGVSAGPDLESGGDHRDGGMRSRSLTTESGQRIFQRRITGSTESRDRAALELRLESEICAGLRLQRRYEPADYPRMLPKIIGYAVDRGEPFVLWHPSAGRPLRDVAGRLLVADLEQVIVDLFSGLACLADCGIVHRGITPDTIRWTGDRAVFDGFAMAALEKEPRSPIGSLPWASPEQRSGSGHVERRDDIWSAAVVLSYLISGQQATAANPPQPAQLGPKYGQLLADTLAPRGSMRPDALTVLSRLSIEPPRNAVRPVDGAMAAGAQRFLDVVTDKRHRTEAAPAARGQSSAGERPVKRSWWRSAPPPPPPPQRARSEFVPRRCYMCLDTVEWQPTDLFIRDNATGTYQALPLTGVTDVSKREEAMRHAFKRCPNPSKDAEPHYLPVQYLRSDRPISVGIVGQSLAGKSHLLAGIMREIEDEGLASFGINTGAVDIAAHDQFRQNRVVRLYDDRRTLEHTQASDSAANFADGVMLYVAGAVHPLMFFDVAGELFLPGNHQQRPRATQFLAAVDALIFVVNAAPKPNEEKDTTFGAVLDRLSYRQGPDGLLDVPSAIVISQSDKLRFTEPIDQWIRLRDRGKHQIDRDRIVAESRDGYAFLHGQNRVPLLTPFSRSRRCTLHFVSATGGGHDDAGEFRFGARPQRCLDPLLSLLVMTGVLPGWTQSEAS